MQHRTSNDSDVLLLFPPGAPNVAHPEVGLPQLKAHLSSVGHQAAQRDLNAEFVYDYLANPAVLTEIHGLLRTYEVGTDTAAERWYLALDRVCGANPGSMTLDGMSIRDFLTERRAVRGRPFPPEGLRRVTSASGDPFTTLCIRDGLFWATFVEALHYLLFSPRSCRIEDVLTFAGHLPPILDDFLHSTVDAWATREPPLMVGVALWSTPQVPIAIGMARLIRRLWPKVPIVAGGAWCSGADSLLPTFPEIFDDFDAIVIGQGDDAMVDLCERAQAGAAFDGIDNVAVRVGGQVRIPERLRSRRILDSAHPDYEGLDLSLYPQGDVLPIRVQEGCTWRRCAFCYHVMDRIHPRVYREDPGSLIERILAQVRDLSQRWGRKNFFLLDHAVPLELMELLARRAIETRMEFAWVAMARFEHRFDRVDLGALAESGCLGLHFGLETTDPRVLASMNKGITLEGVDRDLDALSAVGVPASVFLMHLPGQSTEDVARDIAWVHERRDKIEGFTIARFEVGRGTRAFAHPESLGITLKPGCDRDIDVFSVPYVSDRPMLSTLQLMQALTRGAAELGRLRGEHFDNGTQLTSEDHDAVRAMRRKGCIHDP